MTVGDEGCGSEIYWEICGAVVVSDVLDLPDSTALASVSFTEVVVEIAEVVGLGALKAVDGVLLSSC